MFSFMAMPDVVQDRNAFVRTLETLAHYLVEFNEDGTIKDKVYPPGCEVYGSESRPIILITHDEATFSWYSQGMDGYERRSDILAA